jgi:3-hydroxyisobutyrate dehydrogenase
MASGAEAALARVSPLIETMSEKWTNVGALGNAMALKVIHNAVIHGVMVVLAEALALARATGADAGQLVTILKDPDRGLLRPLTHRVAERMLTGDFDGGMPTEAALKDSVLALELSQQAHVPLFALQSSHAVYEAAVAMGLGRLDYAAIAKLWEQWGGYTFAG